jgi:phenylalanyl-tRNA synthetase beta chain
MLGELHPRVREVFGLPETPTILADLDVNALRGAVSGAAEVVDPPRFPAVVEDVAVIVNEDVPAAQVEQTVLRSGGNLLHGARLFDVYRGEQIGAGKKSLAFSLTYQADDRTLTDKDIEKPRAKIIRAVEGQLGGSIRKG